MVEVLLALLFALVCTISICFGYVLRVIVLEQKRAGLALEKLIAEIDEQKAVDKFMREQAQDTKPIPDMPELVDMRFRNRDGKLSYKAAIENKRIAEQAKKEGAIEDLESIVWKETGGK